MQEGKRAHIPGIFYRFTGRHGGHVRIFGKPGHGFAIYSWNQMLDNWALVRRWHLGPFATICHVNDGGGKLKTVGRPGWKVALPKVKLTRQYGGFAIHFIAADKMYAA